MKKRTGSALGRLCNPPPITPPSSGGRLGKARSGHQRRRSRSPRSHHQPQRRPVLSVPTPLSLFQRLPYTYGLNATKLCLVVCGWHVCLFEVLLCTEALCFVCRREHRCGVSLFARLRAVFLSFVNESFSRQNPDMQTLESC